MFKFNHIDMEKEDNPVLWDRISKDDFNLIMKCKNLYEQCIAYTGRNIHEVCGCAGNLLNGTDHFLFSFTEKFINKKYDIDAFPKEIVHIFSSAIISALNTEGMGVHIMAMGLPALFNPNETYETVQVEADLMEFESNE